MKALGPGARIADRYVLETVIAKGGMGAVYRAIDEKMGRTVAIKVLLAELAEDETSIARFEREASASARLTHPGIVQVFDFGKQDGLSYIVMEHVVGRTLANELDTKKRIAPHRACDIMEQALAGIGAAHEAGLIHRDLKPGNIMLIPTGTGREVVKVLDFGIVQLKESPTYARLTKTGAVLGTPTFMSPEQARGETCDARTDVYAMGVVLWCCLTGQRPFVAADVPTTLGKVLGEMPPRADKIDPSIPAAIAHATERAMEKRASARYPTAADFAQALADARASSAIPATSTVSLPPEPPRDSYAPVTREISGPASHASDVTRVDAVVSVPPTPAPASAPSWQRWAIAGVGVALVLGLVLGGLLVLGVIELETGALRGLPTTPPTSLPTGIAPPSMPPPPSMAPMLNQGQPQIAPQQGLLVPAAECEQLLACCTAFRERVRPSFPDCDTFVAQLGGDAALCTDRLGMFAQLAANEGDRTVPPECVPP